MRLRMMLPTVGVLTFLCGAQAFAAPVVVTCGRSQRAIVHDTFVRGESVTSVRCVNGEAYRSYRSRYETRYRVRHSHRSWGQRALVIGGSAATGAGIGGIVHGKSGALIGAAVGGGAASIIEGTRRR
jgi:hypothetical protein